MKVYARVMTEINDAVLAAELSHHENQSQAIQACLETGQYEVVEILDFYEPDKTNEQS